jgi:membrane-associated phospholipid phosphatase
MDQILESLFSKTLLVPDYIGLYAPKILTLFSLFLLRNKIHYLTIYSVGYLLNFILNILLKLALKEPRPKKTKRVLEIAIANDYEYEYEKFGMPSGHAQACVYSLVFITLVLNNPLVTSVYLAVTCLALFQRFKYLEHSFLQLTVGVCVGLSIGYMFYLIGNKYIKGNIKMRADDSAPK